MVLFACAVVNLFTKQVATIAGISFTLAFFVRVRRVRADHVMRRRRRGLTHLDQFQLEAARDIVAEALGCRPGGVLVPVRDYNTLRQLDWVLGQPESENATWSCSPCACSGQTARTPAAMGDDQMFSEYEQRLFTRVVAIAERHGRKVTLLVAPGTNVFDALAQSAVQLRSGADRRRRIRSDDAERQALAARRGLGSHAAGVEGSRRRLVVLCKDGGVKRFSLGAHTPDLTSEDLERIHRIWVEAVEAVGPEIHHRDIVTIALKRLDADLDGATREKVSQTMRDAIGRKDA